MVDRQDGYYWVKISDTFVILWWEYNMWWDGSDVISEGRIEHINEVRIKEPGELPEL